MGRWGEGRGRGREGELRSKGTGRIGEEEGNNT